ncbi:hypothetical protein KSF_046290 [Reticulibacter mediterranei]|uniref:Uncharacterized protein n=1 Tax=Reticulibacter mediterranei TaxID=2778369 RepID=A0A8J3ISP1_9CHLR|nr:hypothetical protein KSF_046290 [Reticulibacter mediterranei]
MNVSRLHTNEKEDVVIVARLLANASSGDPPILTNYRANSLNQPNRRMRTRLDSGVGGKKLQGFPYPDYRHQPIAHSLWNKSR